MNIIKVIFLFVFIFVLTACSGGGGTPTTDNTITATSIVQSTQKACALLSDGSVRCWGDNTEGYLGLGYRTDNRGDAINEMGDNLPVLNLGTGKWAIQLTQGTYHSCALLNDNSVKCWGDNYFGQLGSNPDTRPGDELTEMGDNLATVDLGAGRTASMIMAGANHTCALLDDSTVKCWGYNAFGQLGLGDKNNRGDNSGEMGDNLQVVDLGTGRTATAIAAGNTHSCALLDNATVKCWGGNAGGVLGQGVSASLGDHINEMGDNLSAIDLGSGRTATSISSGGDTTCAILDNTDLKCWGYNLFGQLGLGDTNNRGDGANEMGDNLPAIDLGAGRTATMVSIGYYHMCAQLDNSTVKCWGQNGTGQLGQGDTVRRGDGINEMGDNLPAIDLGTGRTSLKIAATGSSHTCVLLDNNQLKCWGYNSAGQLGLGDQSHRGDQVTEMGDNLPVVDLGTGLSASTVTVRNNSTCVILSNLETKCWGSDSHGQLGLGESYRPGDEAGELAALPAVNLGDGRTATAIAAGASHVCALLDNSTVKCWGQNTGALGLGDGNARGDEAGEMGNDLPNVDLGFGRTATAIAAGSGHSCAILDDASIKCWGQNNNGQLGLGDKLTRGDQANEMGDNLLSIDLGTGHTAIAIAAGGSNTCAVLDDASVKCWGVNTYGQLGQGDTTDRGDDPGEMGDALFAIDLGSGRTAKNIKVSSSNTGFVCAVLDDDNLKCWGHNGYGQLGLEDNSYRGDNVGEMGDNLPSIDLGNGRSVIQASVGSSHACALLDDASLKCWGNNSYGELGQGDKSYRGSQANDMGDNLIKINLGNGLSVKNTWVGYSQSCALLSNDSAKCWGNNQYGQLGAGVVRQLGDEPNEMGDNLPVLIF